MVILQKGEIFIRIVYISDMQKLTNLKLGRGGGLDQTGQLGDHGVKLVHLVGAVVLQGGTPRLFLL
jgi:hypothetical protein